MYIFVSVLRLMVDRLLVATGQSKNSLTKLINSGFTKFPEFADIFDRNCRLREISASQVITTLTHITELVLPFHSL